MKSHYLKIAIITIIILILGSCKKNNTKVTTESLNTVIKNIQEKYAPDRRTARFDANITENNHQLVIKGVTTSNNALSDFKKRIDSTGIIVLDSIQVLPNNDLKGMTGIINNSVANIRSTKGDASEMASQALLGTPVTMLQKIGGWYMIQTPDKYIGWIYQSELVLKDTADLNSWLTKPKLIFTEMYGNAYKNTDANEPVSDLVTGDILILSGEDTRFYYVTYPDGREAFVLKKQAQPYKEWLANLHTTEETLVKTSKQFLGFPYLWGGTSPKGVDCSGFTKSVYFLNGMVIPRDASQQVLTGELIDDKKDFSKLMPGDLLFFGRISPEGKEKVVHVGMWIGNNEFIHASGRVKIGSMDKNAPNYDEANYNRYLRTKRVFGQHTNGIQYLNNNLLYTKS